MRSLKAVGIDTEWETLAQPSSLRGKPSTPSIAPPLLTAFGSSLALSRDFAMGLMYIIDLTLALTLTAWYLYPH